VLGVAKGNKMNIYWNIFCMWTKVTHMSDVAHGPFVLISKSLVGGRVETGALNLS
jgi:hypothetical protein